MARLTAHSAFLFVCFFCFGCLALALLASAQLPQYCGKDPGLYQEYSIPAPLTNLTLRQVHTFIRHGDRLPASGGGATSYATCWPGDDVVWNCTLNYDEIPDNTPSQFSTNVPRLYRKEYDAGRNVFPGNCLMGQLTQNGYEQQLANGKILREAYVVQTPLLGETLNINEVHIRSSDIPRTVQSAHTLMLGLFPPNNTGEAQIVNLHTMDVSVDPTPLNPALCPILSEVLAAAAQSPEFITHYTNQTAAVAAQLATALGETPDTFNLDFAFDCLNTHICHNFPIPSGVTDDLYNAMMTEETWIFQYLFTYPNVTYASQIGIGFYLLEFSEAINNFVDGDQETLFYLWSAHDTTLMLIMNMFGFSDNQWPAYASMINFELYQDDYSDYYVRALHNGVEVTIPACGSNVYCPWNTFNTFLSTLLPVNPAVQCVPTSSQTLRDPIFDLKEDKILSHVIHNAMRTAHRLAEKQRLL